MSCVRGVCEGMIQSAVHIPPPSAVCCLHGSQVGSQLPSRWQGPTALLRVHPLLRYGILTHLPPHVGHWIRTPQTHFVQPLPPIRNGGTIQVLAPQVKHDSQPHAYAYSATYTRVQKKKTKKTVDKLDALQPDVFQQFWPWRGSWLLFKRILI